METVQNGKLRDGLAYFLGSFSTMINCCVSSCQMSVFNGKTYNLQTRKYDVTGSKEYLIFFTGGIPFVEIVTFFPPRYKR